VAHVIENLKDGVDQIIEQTRAVERSLERRDQTDAVVYVRQELKTANDALQRARARIGVARL